MREQDIQGNFPTREKSSACMATLLHFTGTTIPSRQSPLRWQLLTQQLPEWSCYSTAVNGSSTITSTYCWLEITSWGNTHVKLGEAQANKEVRVSAESSSELASWDQKYMYMSVVKHQKARVARMKQCMLAARQQSCMEETRQKSIAPTVRMPRW